ncbi:MAG: radical SAM protein [Synergistetes bacterium]|nr:radical SAM protein [Synergistota bacterium]
MEGIAFGPVPSRRLGKSLGINNIPVKICSYSCTYCQVGKTLKLDIERRSFYSIDLILKSVESKLEVLSSRGEKLDYITYVPDGEPTLDINLGEEVKALKKFGVPIAIISNASLIWRSELREELCEFALVSLKIDAVTPELWRYVNRPHPSLDLDKILEGMLTLKKAFPGKLITETMLLDGIDYSQEGKRLADFLSELAPDTAYLAIPTRPPAEADVKPARECVLNAVFQEISDRGVNVEYLIGYEGSDFSATGDPEKDLLSIMSVHPMRGDAVYELLKEAGAPLSLLDKLLEEGKVVRLTYSGNEFFMRKLPTRE